MRQGVGPGHSRTLQNANREALHLLGLPMNTTGDPKGRVLRQLRLQLSLDPSLLATQACMSLSQLYELEDGGNSRFYSDSLRRQAGRRVARLLGADWDRMELEEKSKAPTPSNVVQLQRPSVHVADNVPTTPEIVEVKVRVMPEQAHSVTSIAQETPVMDSINSDQAVSMGLEAPAVEVLLVAPPKVQYAATAVKTVKERSGWSSVVTWLLVIAFCSAAYYAFEEYSPYRFYWPW
jgi:hypothetical protein